MTMFKGLPVAFSMARTKSLGVPPAKSRSNLVRCDSRSEPRLGSATTVVLFSARTAETGAGALVWAKVTGLQAIPAMIKVLIVFVITYILYRLTKRHVCRPKILQ